MSRSEIVSNKKDASNEEPKSFPSFKMSIFSLVIILVVSYGVYYKVILSAKNIFLNDINELYSQYQVITENINIDKLTKDNYDVKGTIFYKEKEYDFNVKKVIDDLSVTLNMDNQVLNYYTTSDEEYIKLSSLNTQYYELNNNINIDIADIKKEYVNKLSDDKFVKKAYIENYTFIVESNLILNNEEIRSFVNLDKYNSNYEVLCKFKNNGITNEIISMEVIIKDLTLDISRVLLYDGRVLNYIDEKYNLEFVLKNKDDDNFTLKIYQDDILFSVLSGINKEDSYQYIYQVIDDIYNVTLNINNNKETSDIEIISLVGEDNTVGEEVMVVTLEDNSGGISENTDIVNSINYNTLSDIEKEQFKFSLDSIIGELKKFIDKHK